MLILAGSLVCLASLAQGNNSFSIGGFLQSGYSVDENSNTFYLKRARLAVNGDLSKIADLPVDFKLQADFAGSPKLVDLYVRYKPSAAFNLQFGQFKLPLTIENPDFSPTKLEFIDYSLVVQRLARMSGNDMSGISATGRDIGIQAFGSLIPAADGHYYISYKAGFFNGSGINKSDTDRFKDFTGRIDFNPLSELTLAGYYMVSLGDEAPRMDRFGGGLSYQGSNFFARSEYLAGHTGSLYSGGLYAMCGYKPIDNLSLVARYDRFNPELSLPASQQYYTVGAIFAPFKFLQVHLNYTYKTETDHSAANCFNILMTVSY